MLERGNRGKGCNRNQECWGRRGRWQYQCHWLGGLTEQIQAKTVKVAGTQAPEWEKAWCSHRTARS